MVLHCGIRGVGGTDGVLQHYQGCGCWWWCPCCHHHCSGAALIAAVATAAVVVVVVVVVVPPPQLSLSCPCCPWLL